MTQITPLSCRDALVDCIKPLARKTMCEGVPGGTSAGQAVTPGWVAISALESVAGGPNPRRAG